MEVWVNFQQPESHQQCESEWASLLPNAQQTGGLSALIKVVSLGHITITSCYTNLDQNSASASRPSFNFIISTRYQHQNIDQTPASKSRLNFNIKILTKPCGQSLNENLASITWPNFPDYFKPSWYFWIISDLSKFWIFALFDILKTYVFLFFRFWGRSVAPTC